MKLRRAQVIQAGDSFGIVLTLAFFYIWACVFIYYIILYVCFLFFIIYICEVGRYGGITIIVIIIILACLVFVQWIRIKHHRVDGVRKYT